MRSAVRSGVFDARDRGTKRRRDRSRPSEARSPDQELRAWLEDKAYRFLSEAGVDIDRYLQATSFIAVDEGERLRLLAVNLEYGTSFQHLERVYQRAARFSPDDPWVFASWGISAGEHAKLKERHDSEQRTQLFTLAHQKLSQAATMDPHDAQIVYAQGCELYFDHDKSQSIALECFDKALELEPKHPWACLYRSHCLHDLERWKEAADAYHNVPLDGFDGPKSWRTHLLVEQRALCLMKAGELERSLAEFEKILTRYEKQIHLARWGDLKYLRQAVDTFPQLRQRVQALTEALDKS